MNKEELNSFRLPTCTRSNKTGQYRDAIRNVRQMSTEWAGSLPAETKVILINLWINNTKPRILICKRSKIKRNLDIAIQHVLTYRFSRKCNTVIAFNKRWVPPAEVDLKEGHVERATTLLPL